MCLGLYRNRKGVQAYKGTGKVPGHIRAPKWCPKTYGHCNGAWVHMGNGMVSGHIWETEGCSGTYGHLKGAWTNMGTGVAPKDSGAHMCPGTQVMPICTRAHMSTRMVPGHILTGNGALEHTDTGGVS